MYTWESHLLLQILFEQRLRDSEVEASLCFLQKGLLQGSRQSSSPVFKLVAQEEVSAAYPYVPSRTSNAFR